MAIAEAMGRLRAWRVHAVRACRYQYGIWLAVPVVWGSLESLILPWWSAAGFLAAALFLEARPGRRLLLQALIFIGWAAWLDRAEAAAARRAACMGPRLEGTVEGFAVRKAAWTFRLETGEGSCRITAEELPFPVRPGQRLAVQGRAAPSEPPTNPGQFDYPAYLRSQGLAGVYRAESLSLLARPGPWPRAVAAAHDAVEEALRRSIPPENLPLLAAMLLGHTAELDPDLTEDFRASGMLHILAISGQHVGIVALILLQVFGLLRLPRKASFLAAGLVLALYVPVSGGSISVLRSVVMFWCALPAILWERPGFAFNNLALAAVLCLLWMPHQILSLGFQLSFAATFFLVLYSRPVSAFLARRRLAHPVFAYLLSTPLLSLAIFLGLWPLLAATVHTLAPSSLLGNLATVVLSSAMLVAGCLALLAEPLCHPLAQCFGEAAGAFASLLTAAVRLLAGAPGSDLSAAALAAPWSLSLLLLLLVFPWAVRAGRGRAVVLAGMALFAARWGGGEAWRCWARPHEVAFLDVGQGDGAVLALPGATVLMDAGPPGAGEKVILPYLRSRGLGRLDLAVVTNADLDHYGGLAELVGRVDIGRVVYPGVDADTRSWRALCASLAAHGIPMETARRGADLYRDGVIALEALSPAAGPGPGFASRNDNSLVCLLRLPGRRMLFTGDIEAGAEQELLRRDGRELAGAVLKVPHHGSDRTNDMAFFAALRPPVAVVSAGRRNRYGHPGPEAMAVLESLGARVHVTARDGAAVYRGRRGVFAPRGGASWRAGGRM